MLGKLQRKYLRGVHLILKYLHIPIFKSPEVSQFYWREYEIWAGFGLSGITENFGLGSNTFKGYFLMVHGILFF